MFDHESANGNLFSERRFAMLMLKDCQCEAKKAENEDERLIIQLLALSEPQREQVRTFLDALLKTEEATITLGNFIRGKTLDA